jgi:Ferritin-like domain
MKNELSTNTSNVNMARRSFLRYAGAGVAGMGLLATAASCHKDHNVNPNNGFTDVGMGDIGILNYAYALEQLEAAFYTQVIATPYSGIPAIELTYLTEIRDHEIAHREFFKAALSTKAIKALTPDFSSINFKSRASVLGAAKSFEDLGVTAYDGVGYLIQTPAYLSIAGAIVSVEARHAALIANLLGTSFVDSTQVDANGLNISNKPSVVLKTANTYLKTKVSAVNFS